MTKPIYKELEDPDKKSLFSFFKRRQKKVKSVTRSDIEYQANYYRKTGIVRIKNDELTFLLSLIM